MEHGYDKHALKKRIEGQVRGIERMVDDDRYCIDILTQVGAVKPALERMAFEILNGHVTATTADQREHHGHRLADLARSRRRRERGAAAVA